MLKKLTVLLCIIFLVSLFGCAAEKAVSAEGAAEPEAQSSAAADVELGGMELSVSDRDLDAGYDEASAAKIIFSEGGAEISGSGVSAEGTKVTLSSEGTYIVSGSCPDGQIYIDAGDSDKLQIVLDGLELSSKESSPFIIANADKVFLTLAGESQNSLADASSYELTVDGSTVDGAIFSKADITINGSGSLAVSGNYKHAVVSKDDLVITGGTLDITAQNVGLEGKDCVKLTGGDISVLSGTDGVRSTNEEDAARGFVYIDGANLTVDAGTDGIQAVTLVDIVSGSLEIVSGGGSENASYSSGDSWGSWGGFGGFGNMPERPDGAEMPPDMPSDAMPGDMPEGLADAAQTASSDSDSAKGIKSAGDILISGGSLVIDSSDDSIHSNGSIELRSGEIEASSGDDGIHADTALTIDGGSVNILKSYEGLEAGALTINGGDIYVYSYDDGLNAAGGNDLSSLDGRMGQNAFAGDSSKTIAINGGYLVVNASGDGLDSNGSITVTGGVVLVSGPVDSANGALDYGTEAKISGGLLVAAGSSGMAESFSEDSAQGSIMVNIDSQQAETPIALLDESGNALISFAPMKQYSSVVFSAPGIESGRTYTISTGSAQGADEYGFSQDCGISGGSILATVEMTSLHYGTSGSMPFGGGGAGGPGGKAGKTP